MDVNNCQSCDRVSSNKYSSCPALMSDGRIFTDYNTRCSQVNDMFGKKLNSYEYRQFLIKNADELMDNHRKVAYATSFCGPCKEPREQGTMLPEEEKTICNGSVCTTFVNNPKGLGRGRDYMSSNLTAANQCAFGSFENVRSEEHSDLPDTEGCCGVSSYPFKQGTQNARLSVPSGAQL